MPSRRRLIRRAFALALFASSAAAAPAAAQESLFQRLNIDKLAITSLGVAFGRVIPSQVVPANLVALQGDYGNIAPEWRVVFGASYWESRLRDKIVQTFVDSLQKSVTDPAARVAASPVRLYDVTFNVETRYTRLYRGWITPFAGVGVAAHVINAEGKLIKGTFVERSLDDIAAGLFVTSGLSLKLLPHFGVEGAVRADLLSGFRSTQIRGGANYYFGHIRLPEANPSGGSQTGSSRE